ncbi:MAG: hypothetical protein GXP31_03295 [Kiritimatiellaeota bacterium]|nr:hypothetical protein [Kiritimatiellota bacterium]
MTAEERLVGQIRDFLRRYNQEKDPATEELADQYADLCRQINERLVKCNDFLEKGMRSEAVQEAQVPPLLIELVDTVTFPEVTKWRNICADLEMTVFPPLRMEIVDRLRQECSTEEFLSPLLHEYRRLVHQGALDERIRVLRRIRELDPENPVWEENLAPLEKDQQEKLLPVARRALTENDIPRLQKLYDDLTDPRRVVEPPERLVGKIGAVLRRHREQQAREEGARLARDLEAALAEKDHEQIRQLIRRWDRLSKFEDFHPSESVRSVAARAQRWYSEERARRQADAEFAAALEELRVQLDLPLPDPVHLQTCLLRVQSFGKPLPPGLEDSVQDARERVRVAAARRRFRRTATVLVFLVILLAAGAVAGAVLLRNIQRRNAIHTVQAFLDVGDEAGLRQYLDDLRRERPHIFRVPAVQQALKQSRAEEEARRTKAAEFEQVMGQLDKVRGNKYDLPGPRLRQLLDRAEKLAVTPQAQARLKGWRLAFELWNTKRRQELDDRFSALLRSLGDAVVRAPALKAGPLEIEGKALEQARKELQQALDLAPSAAEDRRAELAPLEEAVKKWDADYTARLARRREQEARRLRTLRVMDRALPDIDAYRDLLQGFLDEFPGSPEHAALRKALAELPMYQDAVALQALQVTELPMSAAILKQARDLLAKLQGGPAPSIWAGDLQRAVTITEAQSALRKALPSLSKLDFFSLHVFYIRPKGAAEWEPVYYPDNIISQDRKLSDGATITLYWGKAFRGDPEEKEPILEHVKFSTSEYDVKIRRRRESNLIPAAKFARAVLAEGARVPRTDDFLLDAMQRLLRSEEIQPVPKLLLLRALGNMLADALGAAEPEIAGLGDLLADVRIEVSWLNRKNPNVPLLEQRVRDRLGALPDFAALKADVHRNQELLRLALDRRVSCVGLVKRDPDTPTRLIPSLRLPHLRTAWIITVDPTGRRRQFLRALEADAGGGLTFTRDVRNKIFLGQLLFAPGDGLPASTVLRNALPEAPHSPRWPQAWPVNQRALPKK